MLNDKSQHAAHSFIKCLVIFVLSSSCQFINAQQDQQNLYDSYAGDYEITGTFILSVTHDNGSLYAQATGQKKFLLNSESLHNFSYEGSDQSLHFNIGEDGTVESVTQKVDRFTRNAPKQGVDNVVEIDPHALSDAINMGNTERVKSLLEAGVDPQVLDTRRAANGRYPLNWAALGGDVEIIELLLDAGADINQANLSGFTPLHHAIEGSSVEAARLLIQRGADLSMTNRARQTPLQLAQAMGRSAIVTLIEASTQ